MAPHPRNSIQRLPRFLLRLFLSTVVIAAFFVVTQDFQIFPGLYGSFRPAFQNTNPPDIEPISFLSSAGKKGLIWRMEANETPPRGAALLFHGNGEHLSSFLDTQRWLRSLGVTSYAVEYRGYNGWGSGWPSEEGLYQDALVAYSLMKKREALPEEKLLILGNSIGTGIAAHVATKSKAKMLLLLAPYASLRQVVKEMPLYGYLSPFLWYEFPNQRYLSNLHGRHILIAHGKQDTVIPFHHSLQLKDSLHPSNTLTFLERDGLGHNGLLQALHKEIGMVITQQLTSTSDKGNTMEKINE